ncbi:hypothetical protein TrVE_jg4854 [Triparma verrucosa]|uniref:ABC transporter domain-containing protein n=2 Tax=Triparma TaxID=722752 RepID=A0A9W7B2R0_9STRA|nr:hypothetical protein TrVE_jg4854 [Triparma verrucosa]GMH83256.1 hypothetical protein TrST_g5144 [Triparma strigata]
MKVVNNTNEVELGATNFSALPSSEIRSKSLKWNDLSFAMKEVKGEIPILSNQFGSAPASTLTCIMGPSGAGKSSLLNVLAGRVANGGKKSISGNISVDGTPIDPYTYRKQIAYVMQDDAISPTSTPREALTFSASLRLGGGATRPQIDKLVSDMLEELGLSECADRMVGGELIKGISGGERKRTSVGVELVTDPSLVFLDEPTSGLDSYSAHQLVLLLKRLANTGRATVLCTIHQPSSEVFLLFDNTILLKDGRVVYGGKVADMNSYFAGKSFPVPENTNPADHAMFTVQINSGKELDAKGVFMIDAEARELKKQGSTTKDGKDIVPDVKSTAYTQLRWLCSREFDALRRDKAALVGRFGITIFLNVLFGLIFNGAADKDDSINSNFGDHFGALTMVTISSMFGAAQPTLLAFPSQRPIFLREYSTGTYSILPYIFSKLLFEIPLAFSQTLVQWLVVYWMIGFQGNFFLLLLSSFALGVASASVAVLLGSAVEDVKTASELMPVMFVPQMLFAGFFVAADQIPEYLRWAQYLCSLKYAMNLLSIVEFGEDSCQAGAEAQCAKLLDGNEVEEDLAWFYILVLFGLFAVFRTVGAYVLTVKATTVF